MKAVLRRTHAELTNEPVIVSAGDLKINLTRRILWRAAEEIRLSPREFDLMAFRMKNQGAPLTHVRLLRAVWGPNYGQNSSTCGPTSECFARRLSATPRGRSIF